MDSPLLHTVALVWMCAVALLVAMVSAHAPVKTVAEIIHDAERK